MVLEKTEGPLKPTEHLLRRADGAMNLTKRALPPSVRSGRKRRPTADGSSLHATDRLLSQVSLGEHAHGDPLRSISATLMPTYPSEMTSHRL